MAKQVGPFKFLGKLGNLFGYLVNGEYYVRTIGKVDDEIRKHAPQYEVTRQNEAEFGVATKCGQLFRQAMAHITQRWTTKHYTPRVMQLMMETLRSDTMHVKGQKSINCGLKNGETQMAFRRLEIYTKKNYTHYRGSLMKETKDPLVWKMNHQVLWSKRDDGDTKSIKLGLLHVDFDRKIAKYEDALSITCKRNDQIEYSEVRIEPSSDIKLPWTFVIQQVWRDGDIQEPTGMLFMNVLQVIEGEMATDNGLNKEEIIQGQGSLNIETHGLFGVHQKSSVVDENGVNWDVFLDRYLGDGFDGWEMDEAERKGLDRVEVEEVNSDYGLHSEEEIDMQVVLGLLGVEDADLHNEVRLNEVENVDGYSEHRLNGAEVAEDQSSQGLHSAEVVNEQIALGLLGVDAVKMYSEQDLNEVGVVNRHSEKELHCSDDFEPPKERKLFGVEVGDVHRGVVVHSLNGEIMDNGGLERFANRKLHDNNLHQSQRQKKKRFKELSQTE